MAKMDSLYKDYFQKSRVFLYPALEIKRGSSVTPVQCYVSWDGHYKPEDRRFICLYQLRDDDEFLRFERSKLTGHKLFEEFYQIDDEKGIYVFDFDGLADDWEAFLAGRYSQMSAVHKRKIKNFYGIYSSNFVYVDSFLSPEKYYGIYSELLDVDIELLQKVGELCSKPDLQQENLTVEIKPYHLQQA
jgi:hypothetical protein